MNDFNNFFDDQRGTAPQHTPIYHTPEPKHKAPTASITAIVCIIIAVIMCILVVVNVIVLSTLKSTIADEYASKMSEQMRAQYEQAVNASLVNTDIISDVTSTATKQVIDALDSTIGEAANEHSASVARLYMFTSTVGSSSFDNAAGLATGFLISDTDDNNTPRYIVTNAHCVRYVKETVKNLGGYIKPIPTYEYTWTSYSKIICVFENENVIYNTEIVAFGGYYDSDYKMNAENDQADLAILRIVGKQPSNSAHPSLKIASSDTYIKRGTPVALIGNPEGIGNMNTITSGTISQTGISIKSWGPGTFLMTDAAVNSGNSGGPMIDSRGIVQGVVESKLVSDDIDNMGFALSADTLKDFLNWAVLAQNNTLKTNLKINCRYE